ncbi:hypothetical protein FA13DRAFT_1797502 [Coprinellus micaceus]|uniref:ATPase AAA-type core domain-containing protein n=1 Tax=Coprinellus micaceus TaxID=71717 RepID=A0A4Y7SSA1_COPMI|nr:hypothetical protein FA13DRAFT_1797502 [Coprinellus micaceus]
MPSPFRKFGHNVKSLFRGRSRDRRPNTDHPGAVDVATTTSSAPPSTTAGLLPPIVVVTPTRSMVDVTENPIERQDTGGYGLSPSAAHPSPHSSSHRSPSERPSLEAAPLGVQPQSSDNPVTDIALSDSRQQPVPESPYPAQLPPTPLPHKDTLSPPPIPTPVAANTSFFSGAQNVSVSEMNINNSVVHSKSLFEYLNPHIAHGAAHDSDERWNAPSCHEETRVAIREDIVSWIKHGEQDEEPKRMMWLSSPAGCGKSAIAGSVAETCKKEDIFRKNLNEQANRLILEPFRKVHNDQESRAGWPTVVIIDGLDEVVAAQHPKPTDQQSPSTSEDDQVEILRVLITLSKHASFPFRIFVASHPESNTTHFFTTDAQDTTVRLFLDSKYNPDADVERFLVSKFAHIRRRAGITSSPWPGQSTLDRLVDMSSGQFIVPTTIIRWVEAGVPQLQLAELLQFALPNSGTENPFATLDALYRHILLRANNPKDDLHLVVKWIKCITSEVSPAANCWRQFLENVEGELNYRLAPITSLISVPPPNDTTSPITIYHKSLTDFLSSPARCGDLYVEDTEHTSFLSERIFVVLKSQLFLLLYLVPTSITNVVLLASDKGPIVPLPSPPDLARFLYSFFNLYLIYGQSPDVLTSLSSRSKAELASCDVAWWTTASLSNLPPDGSSLSQDRHRTKSSEGWGYHPWLAQMIYYKIHQAMGCGSEAHLLAQDAARQAQGSKCHAACMHWRTGILAKAKELGWCVHELEEVGLDHVETLSLVCARIGGSTGFETRNRSR